MDVMPCLANDPERRRDGAAPADAAAAADRVDVDAERPRRVEDGRAGGHAPRRPEGVKMTCGSAAIGV
jgi:hypothetical protein